MEIQEHFINFSMPRAIAFFISQNSYLISLYSKRDFGYANIFYRLSSWHVNGHQCCWSILFNTQLYSQLFKVLELLLIKVQTKLNQTRSPSQMTNVGVLVKLCLCQTETKLSKCFAELLLSVLQEVSVLYDPVLRTPALPFERCTIQSN